MHTYTLLMLIFKNTIIFLVIMLLDKKDQEQSIDKHKYEYLYKNSIHPTDNIRSINLQYTFKVLI